MASSGPRHTILLFCKFLTHRVRADNLDVLFRIAVESLEEPPCFTRVNEMIYRVYPLVAILPAELPDPAMRAKADRLLQRMREQLSDEDTEEVNELRDLRVALRQRIELVNWDLLEAIYSEFKKGRDRTLREFVALQPESIAILPTCPSKCPAQGDDHDILDARVRVAPQSPHYMKAEIPTTKIAVSSERIPKPVRVAKKNTELEVTETARIVRSALDDVEASAPWSQVFDVSKLAYPFDAREHPVLAKQFVTFWQRHARAVWQRHFWCRIPDGEHDDNYRQLRIDDRVAVTSFENTVMTPLFNQFGAEFFVNLDAQSKRLHWWWYRKPLVDLIQMASMKGTDYCIRYLRTQATKRHPTPHPQFHMRVCSHDAQSPSMWSTSKSVKHIHDAVVRLATQNKSRRTATTTTATTASRKRARSVSTRDEEMEDDDDE